MSGARTTRNTRTRSSGRRHRPRLLGWRGGLRLALILLFICLVSGGAVARLLAPKANSKDARFDAIIVLGSPADSDGNPTPEQLARVTEGVHEYERGVAPRLIMTGGAAHNQFVEARVMARSAEAEGIPAAAISIEPESLNTIENACNARRIMTEHGWQSAEVVSSASHLPRAGLIFNGLGIKWRTHAAPPLEPQSEAYRWGAAFVEDLKTARYLLWSRWSERCEP